MNLTRVHRPAALFCCVILLAAILFSPPQRAIAIAADEITASRPNIVIILADDMGWGDLGCYNRESKTPTPNIDRLADQGIRLTDAHAPASVCVPSRYGLLSGRYPMRGNIKWRLPGCVLADDDETLATLLHRHGYATYCVGKWHLGFACNHPTKADEPMPGGPCDRGFDRSLVMHGSLDIPPYYYVEDGRCVTPPAGGCQDHYTDGWTRIQGAFWRGGGIAAGLKHEDVLPTFTAKAIEYIDTHAETKSDRPMFLYFPLSAPHTPWVPTKEFKGQGGADLYGEFVAQVDNVVGRVIKRLEQRGMTDNTLILFSSDNGPVWYPADVKRFGHASVGPFRGMKGDAYEGGHRMPMVARWPGRIPKGTVTGGLVSFTDIMATLAVIIGDDKLEVARLDSVNVLPVLLGQVEANQSGPRTEMVHNCGGVNAIRVGPWKLIPQLGSCGFTKPRRENPRSDGPRGQLYNLEDDPGETRNLWLERSDVVKQLAERFETIRGQ